MSDLDNQQTDLSPDKRIVSLTIQDKNALHKAYMPFLKHGGIFITTEESYDLGDEIYLLLKLMDETEQIPANGKVVWITPSGAQGGRRAGVGVHFSDESSAARNKIETYLGGALKADRETDTM